MKLKLVAVPASYTDQPAEVVLGDAARPVQPRFRIGRLKRDCDLVLQSEYVSKRHLELIANATGWTLVDLSSRAGTKLNGVRVRANTEYPLHHGDEIRFCGYQFLLSEHESESRVGGSSDLRVIEGESMFASIIAKPDRSWSNLTNSTPENKLQLLLEIIRDLRNPAELEKQVQRLIERLFKLFPKCHRGTVKVLSHPSNADGFYVSVTRPPQEADSRPAMMQGVIDLVLHQQKAVLTEDQRTLCVPLVGRSDQTLGCLQLEAHEKGDVFTQRELELLAGAGLLVSFAIENDMYFAAVTRDRMQQHELKMARDIQQRLLPAPRERVGDYELFAHYRSALHVGGDYYDLVDLQNGGLAVAVGDVSGKGVPAALLMAKISSEIRLLLDLGLDAAEVLRRVNIQLAERAAGGNFVTLALATIDFASHRMSLANAGHPRPLLRLAPGEVVEIGDEAAGLALGIDRRETYQAATVDFPPGAALLLYSDGLSEARAENGDFYGTARVRQSLAGSAGSANETGRELIHQVENFLDDQVYQDDVCVVVVRRAEP